MNEAHGLSVTRSCRCVGLSRAAYYGEPLDWVARDAEIIATLYAVVDTHTRWGFWKYMAALRHRGLGWNHKRLYRVYCGLGLNLPRRTPGVSSPSACVSRCSSRNARIKSGRRTL